MEPQQAPATHLPQQLGLWDGVSIIIGIVVGTTIYEMPWLIFGNVETPAEGLAVWCLGGLLAFVGAMCYAELATTYPRSGGDYVYITRAFGRSTGFVYGWAQLSSVLAASVGSMAFVFANYARILFPVGPPSGVTFAVGAVVVISLLNICGVRAGRRTQNILTLAKVIGLTGVLVAGAVWGQHSAVADVSLPVEGPGLGLAMIFVLYAYGGWNDAAFVAAEVRNPRRNIPLVLLLGTVVVMVIYLLINWAYLRALGFTAIRGSHQPAADTLNLMLGAWGARGMSLLVMISALGAVNGLIFTSARVYSSLGEDHRLFAWLSRWNPRLGSPVAAIAAQALVCVLLSLIVGTRHGLDAVNWGLTSLGLVPLEELGRGGFEALVACTAPVFWMFFLMTGMAVFVLRWKDPEIERPFKVPFYPVFPALFCATCIYMLYSAIDYAGVRTLLGVAPVLLGIPLYWISEHRSHESE